MPLPVSVPYKRVSILGCPLSLVSPHQAARKILQWARARRTRPALVLFRDAHSLLAGRDKSELRHLEHHADLVLPDGMPLVWMARAHGHHSAKRTYGPDIMRILCSLKTRRPVRHAFLGGAPGGAERLTASFPGLSVAGILAPDIPDGSSLNLDLVKVLNDMNADILWVGLGAPKQDAWMATHQPHLNAGVVLGVGAAFDFLSGTVHQAPRILHQAGLEWLWRMGMDPKRLIPRYVKTVPRFAILALQDLLRMRMQRR